MVESRDRRRPTDARAAAEAAFRKATTKPAAAAPAPAAPAAAPGVREMVSLRLDSAVLEHFQKDGPGWQDRINTALKGIIAREG
ncbi:BrnA antitoxin family protein [Methylobacterium komagatae]|uniref:BrnA antitoxin family protein n=1 Tax=Methylobacterium komagatae TaxID=374425 RepID=A0ABW2BLP5_9HYPH